MLPRCMCSCHWKMHLHSTSCSDEHARPSARGNRKDQRARRRCRQLLNEERKRKRKKKKTEPSKYWKDAAGKSRWQRLLASTSRNSVPSHVALAHHAGRIRPGRQWIATNATFHDAIKLVAFVDGLQRTTSNHFHGVVYLYFLLFASPTLCWSTKGV